jgi:hypothetical protein
LNDEERTAQIAQLASATSANNATLVVINAWQALTNTGASGKFVDSSLSTLDTHVTSRITTVSTRITQIATALGSVTDNGDGTVSFSDATAIYPNRWNAINFRLNRAVGSLKKKIGLEKNSTFLDGMIDVLESSKTEYESRMTASKLHSNANGTAEIEVEDSSDFAVNDAVYLVSETQAELTGTIRYITDNNIVLSFTVSSNYTISDLARLYKIL